MSCVHLRLPDIDSTIQTLSEILQQLSSQKSSVEENIHATFYDLQKILDVRKSVLLMEVEVNYTLKHKVRAAEPSHTSHRFFYGDFFLLLTFQPFYILSDRDAHFTGLRNP